MKRLPVAARPSPGALTGWTTGMLLAACLPQYLVPALAVGMRDDFAFTDAHLGLAASVSFGLSATIAPVAGRLVARIGPRTAVVIAATLILISSLGIAAAAAPGAVIGFMALNGAANGIGSPTFTGLVATGVPAAKQGFSFGLLTSAPQIAAFVAGLALPVIAEPLSWRAGFLLPASVSLICVSALAGGFIPRATDGAAMGPRIRGLRPIHVIALAAALASAAVIGMRSFLVVFAVAEGFQEGAAGALMAVMGLVAIASRLGFGLLGDRRPGDALRRAAMLMALTTAGFALMVVGGDALIVAGALIAGGIGWGWQSPLSLAVVSRHPTSAGAAIGIQMSGFFVGALIGPLVIGLLAEHGSYTTAWVMCACLAAAAGTVALIVRRLPHDSPLPPLATGDGM
jgi:MFS family permease